LWSWWNPDDRSYWQADSLQFIQYIFNSFLRSEWAEHALKNFFPKKSWSHFGWWTSRWATCSSYKLNHVIKVYTRSYIKKNVHHITVHPSLILLITLLSKYNFSRFSFSPTLTHNYMHTTFEIDVIHSVSFWCFINSCRIEIEKPKHMSQSQIKVIYYS
jgi:hypothetical protein